MFTLTDVQYAYNGQPVLELPVFSGDQGSHWLILGLSGSGKSTLLHLMGGLLRKQRGTLIVADQDLGALDEAALDRFRGQHIGIVFQQLHLISALSVAENVRIAQYMAGLPQDMNRVHSVLKTLELEDKAEAFPHQLSIGQQQRVAIARAVVNQPKIILADEPTSSLDDRRSTQVLDLLLEQAEASNATLVIATHDHRVKDRIPNQLNLDA